MNTRIELYALSVKFRTLRDEATFRHNTILSNPQLKGGEQ